MKKVTFRFSIYNLCFYTNWMIFKYLYFILFRCNCVIIELLDFKLPMNFLWGKYHELYCTCRSVWQKAPCSFSRFCRETLFMYFTKPFSIKRVNDTSQDLNRTTPEGALYIREANFVEKMFRNLQDFAFFFCLTDRYISHLFIKL